MYFALVNRGMPPPVTQHGVPADMVSIQMGAHDIVDLLRPHACGCQPVEPIMVALVEPPENTDDVCECRRNSRSEWYVVQF